MFTILIIEDDSVIRKILAKRLAGDGISLIFIEHAEYGYEISKLNKIDLFVIDIGLPGDINGIDFYRTIRGLSSYRETCIIVTSVDPDRLKKIDPTKDNFLSLIEKNGKEYINDIQNIIVKRFQNV